ncbi:SDR family NAD(P)-dependent oxidoreductase [Campylobacter sp. 19-13652]|uniref:SDR family NAD(P)-dependent oxidoreductase n=1 Tax=Campylobacter sp. 19-13652 TaxID=2840180 RepID=UPI001C773350|nr:SDR family oxidoreductase [Campylobacter sp. 19-13652]BCX80185.1 hypothetical protein LBC_16470 [Campylobacter sp. 19-13652]
MAKSTLSGLYLVTGASSGIGLECARSIIKSGASVIAVHRSESGLNKLKSSLNDSEKTRLIHEPKELLENVNTQKKWVLELSKKYGRLAGGVLSAGVMDDVPVSAGDFIIKTKQIFQINLFSTLALASGLCDRRVLDGDNKSIVAISSLAAYRSIIGTTAYTASKAALNAAFRVIAKEVARLNIRVNTISPGFIKSPNKAGEITASDVAKLSIFLLSKEAIHISGADFMLSSKGCLKAKQKHNKFII